VQIGVAGSSKTQAPSVSKRQSFSLLHSRIAVAVDVLVDVLVVDVLVVVVAHGEKSSGQDLPFAPFE
jgi:hypothetical protein